MLNQHGSSPIHQLMGNEARILVMVAEVKTNFHAFLIQMPAMIQLSKGII